MKAAEEKLHIPQMLDPQDLQLQPDELSTMTYLSYFRSEADRYAILDAQQSIAVGPGLKDVIAGSPARFVVFARNTVGVKTMCSDCKVSFTIPEGGGGGGGAVAAPASSPRLSVEDKKDGSHYVEYVSAAPGRLRINVLLEGSPIKDSPFEVVVKPAVEKDPDEVEDPDFEWAFVADIEAEEDPDYEVAFNPEPDLDMLDGPEGPEEPAAEEVVEEVVED